MKKIGIRILGCMALLSMVGCGRIEGASVQDLSNTKDAIVESETTLAENNNEYSNKNSLFYSDISSYEIFTDVNSEAALKNLYYNIDEFIDSYGEDIEDSLESEFGKGISTDKPVAKKAPITPQVKEETAEEKAERERIEAEKAEEADALREAREFEDGFTS